MGEARLRRRANSAILAAQPQCIYCGSKADTIEHMPPIQMFRLRHRPQGLEFSSCRECNNGTGRSDLVAALLGRMYPDATAESARAELKKLLQAVANNIPGLLQEMDVSAAGQKFARRSIPNMPPQTFALRADGPILKSHMAIFGAKLGFALHFAAHNSRIPDAGGVQPFYFTNASAARGELPHEVIDRLPGKLTLRQGKKHVSDQFAYSWLGTVDGRHTVFYAVFNDAFASLAITALDRSEYLETRAVEHPVFAPGAFKSGRG